MTFKASLILMILVTLVASASAYEFTQCAGKPCGWGQWPVKYLINSAGTPDLGDEVSIVQKSFARWEAQHQTFCGIAFSYGGKTSISTSEPDGKNVILWTESGWTYGPDVLALTQCWFDSNGLFLDCDIVINGQHYRWNVGEDGDVGDIDLRGTLTHEIGHLWGLDHSDVRESTMFAYYDASSNASDLDYDDIAAAWEVFCEGDLPPDDQYEPDDSRVLADDWGDAGLALTGLKLYDDDWFRFRMPAGKRVKVEVLDEDLLRFKMITMTDARGNVLDQQRCDGDCAVALGDAFAEERTINVALSGEYDQQAVSTAGYDLRIQFVDPGQEGELYDDDDGDGPGGCGCDPGGAYGGTLRGKGSDMGLAALALLAALMLLASLHFARR